MEHVCILIELRDVNRPFAHSIFYSKITRFYSFFFIRIISVSKAKIVIGLARAMEKTTDLILISHWTLLKSEDHFMAKRKFSSCYNIKIWTDHMKNIKKKIYAIFIWILHEGTDLPAVTENDSCKGVMLKSYSEMC